MDNKGVIRISYFYSNYLGGRFQSAGVTLFLQPADKFIFTSKVTWEHKNYEDAIIEGIKSGFNDIGLDISQGISVQLLDVVQHEIDSSWKSFHMAARIAIRTRKDLRELHQSIPSSQEFDKHTKE